MKYYKYVHRFKNMFVVRIFYLHDMTVSYFSLKNKKLKDKKR